MEKLQALLYSISDLISDMADCRLKVVLEFCNYCQRFSGTVTDGMCHDCHKGIIMGMEKYIMSHPRRLGINLDSFTIFNKKFSFELI